MLYLIKSGEYMKIGYTENLRNRMTQYTTDNPSYDLLCICNGTLVDESRWHEKYPKTSGEWGYYNENIVKEFAEKAYLDDIYFEEDEFKLAIDDPGKNFVNSFFLKGTDVERKAVISMCKSKKPFPSVYVQNNDLIWKPSTYSSLNLYINNMLKKLPYKPKKISEKEAATYKIVNTNKQAPDWILETLESREYTYQELETIFEPLFKEHAMKWNKNTSLKLYFPDYISKRKTKNGKKDTYYKFNNF